MPSSGKGKGGSNKIADKVSETAREPHVPKFARQQCGPVEFVPGSTWRIFAPSVPIPPKDPPVGPVVMPWPGTAEEHHHPYHAFVYD